MRDARTIAVVGVSSKPDRPSHDVARYLQQEGYVVYMVNPRETEVLGLIAKGFSFPEIAELLGISSHTVTTYVRRIYEKLEVNTRGSAVYEAVNLGLIRMDE